MPTRDFVHGTSLIAGAPSSPAAELRFLARAADSGRELEPDFHAATPADIERAVDAAARASAAFAATAPEVRAALLERIAALLAERAGGIVELALAETGLARPRLEGELARTTNQLRAFAALLREGSWVDAVVDHGNPARTPLPKPDVRTLLVPLGPVAVFGASNFPLAFSTAGGDTASALAAGCPVIVKGHPLHPGTGEAAARAIVDALRELDLPAGAFAFLHAGGAREREVGLELVRRPALAAAGFTGSLAGGTALARAAAERPRPIPFFGEQGSVNPVFVLAGALREKLAALVSACASSISGSAGQLCTRPGLVFFPAGNDGDAFCENVSRALGAVAPHAMLSRAHREAWERRLASLGRAPGVVELSSGAAAPRHAATSAEVAGVVPRVLRTNVEALRRTPELLDECFGPSALLVECADDAELLAAAELVPGSLTATLWSTPHDAALARRLLPKLVALAGRVVHDGMPTGVEVCAAMVHSGPFPACTRPDSTSVGARAIRRWCRPVAFQNVPDELLPEELREANPRRIARLVDGAWQAAPEKGR